MVTDRIKITVKVYKQGVSLRPVTDNNSKFLSSVLIPVAGSSKHHVQHSLDFVEVVRDIIMEADEKMAFLTSLLFQFLKQWR